MKYAFSSILLFSLISLFSSCEPTTEPVPWEGNYQLSESGGCKRQNLGLGTIVDSCFVYQFDNNLILDFCVTANCCPDSNRFEFSQEVRDDSIIIVVDDIAEDLCFCVCPYVIRAEFYDLPKDMYYVHVLMANGELVRDEQIWRIF
ncbi:MAG: hypothetical protein V3W14_02990 [Candidatus Neomarinimicrobiota bacterium]